MPLCIWTAQFSSEQDPFIQPSSANLEHHLMRSVAFPQAERGCEVVLQQRLLLDAGQYRLVHRLLVIGTTFRKFLLLFCVSRDTTQQLILTYLRLLALLKKRLLGLLVLSLIPCPVLFRGYLLENCLVQALDVYLCLSCDNVSVVHTAERYTIDLERTGNEEHALVEIVQEDDPLAAETASEENKDGAGFQRFPKLGWANRFANL